MKHNNSSYDKMAFSFQSNTINSFLSQATTFMNSNVSTVMNDSVQKCNATNILNVALGMPGGVIPQEPPFPAIEYPGCLADVENSEINIIQRATNACDLNVQNTVNLSAEVYTNVENSIDALLAQENKSTQEFLALGQAAFNMNSADFRSKISNEFVTAIQQTANNNCIGIFQAINDGKLVICGRITNSNINVNQDASVTATTSCINNIIFSAATEQTVLNETLATMDQYNESQQQGIGNILSYLLIGGIVLLVLFAIGFGIYFFFFRGGGGGRGGGTTLIEREIVTVPETTNNVDLE